ncbi:WYL domain-containing protein [Paenarthrobacter sp. Z7-10]|uniref:helix-turn-helix transcriptional regulator n=1 Tax=Paenarthrobacter sp. Z7-10 TaxID=2787635 RepID=UPI0022A9A05A|nr:WYL domain-containing protein [Paenarthrobacter sp. Z7-10]MCZ2404170.1 WYL domain-containing protein [Paenarthrobacter sp. Z7-10]
MSASTTERLLNLVIALLGSRYGRSRDFLRTNIQGYEPKSSDEAFGRMFERDKAYLKRLGIPILAEKDPYAEDENAWKYRIRPQDYRLPEVPLDPQGVTILSLAAQVWEQASVGTAAARALRKLERATGLAADGGTAALEARIRTREPAFDALWDALLNHRTISFSYRRAQSDELTQRTVEPWGLGNKYGQWYLSGHDLSRGGQRLFRLSRIVGSVSTVPGPPFDRPVGYDISADLDALGTGPLSQATLRVPPGSGQLLRELATSADQAGAEADQAGFEGAGADQMGVDGWDTLLVPYREPELLAGELAAMGAAVVVVAPAALRADVCRRLSLARAVADGSLPEVDFVPRCPPEQRTKTTTEDRLRRLLDLVPYLVSHPGVEVAAVAEEFDVSRRQLEEDLALLTLCGLPGYQHGDLIDIQWDGDAVFIRDAEELAKPLRLSQEEACVLLVGLESLRSLPDGTGGTGGAALDAVLNSVRQVAGDGAWVGAAVQARITADAPLPTLSLLQGAVSEGNCVRLRYLVRQRDEVTDRVVEPLRIFSLDSTWYVEAWCRMANGLRNFRLDSVLAAEATGEPALKRGLPRNGTLPVSAFLPAADDVEVVLALSPQAQWAAGAYGAQAQAPLPDGGMAIRIKVGRPALVPELMARLGGGGRVLEPRELRGVTIGWLDAALANYPQTGSID